MALIKNIWNWYWNTYPEWILKDWERFEVLSLVLMFLTIMGIIIVLSLTT